MVFWYMKPTKQHPLGGLGSLRLACFIHKTCLFMMFISKTLGFGLWFCFLGGSSFILGGIVIMFSRLLRQIQEANQEIDSLKK